MRNSRHSMLLWRLVLTTLLGAGLMAGCASSPRSPVAQAPAQKTILLSQALSAYEQSSSRDSLLRAIGMLEEYAASHPADYLSRARLANAYTLLGAAYTEAGRKKAEAYGLAMQWAEAAFLTNPAWRRAQFKGKSFEDSLRHLGLEQLEALEFWKTAMFYSFREAHGPLAKLLRYPRLKQAVAVMAHEEALDRNAMYGNNLMSWGIYFLAQPEWYGGDRGKAAAYLAEAVSVHPRNIVPRWARAKYFAVAMGDANGFRDDLTWVVEQPLESLVGFRPWNLALQSEARQLLADEARYFASAGTR